MTRRVLLATGLLLFAAGCAQPQPPAPNAVPAPAAGSGRNVVLIVVDGLLPEAIDAAPAPNLRQLAGAGATSYAARPVGRAETLPSFVTMVTGLAPDAHGITYNNDRGEALPLPTVYTRAREAGMRAGIYFGKSKLTMLAAPGTAEFRRGPGHDEKDWQAGAGATLAAQFAQDFAATTPRLSLVHLREPDMVGHDAGWMSPAYLAAVREADAEAGVVIAAVRASPASGRTAILVTADHGGEETHHRVQHAASWRIPWICALPGVPAQKLERAPTLLDVAPTVLALLELPPLPAAQGHAVAECLPKAP